MAFSGDVSYQPYKCVSGKWVHDEEAQAKRDLEVAEAKKKDEEAEAHRKYLWDSLRTRVVSDAEMKEVLEMGSLVIRGPVTGWCAGDACYGKGTSKDERDRLPERSSESIQDEATSRKELKVKRSHKTKGGEYIDKKSSDDLQTLTINSSHDYCVAHPNGTASFYIRQNKDMENRNSWHGWSNYSCADFMERWNEGSKRSQD